MSRCEDPEWQRKNGVNTFYPRGTTCFQDPSKGGNSSLTVRRHDILFCSASCVDFGSSGSGVVREWRPYKVEGTSSPVYQYSFVGPLTMSKGCDEALELRNDDTKLRDFIYRGSNPAVVTDATCYMDWIAEQYNLRLDYDYERKASCSQSSGDRRDTNQAECLTAEGFLCDWTLEDNGTVWDSCRLYAEEGIAKNVFQCIDTNVSFDY